MVQSVNVAALRTLAMRVLVDPGLARPDAVVGTIAEVSWDQLDGLFGPRHGIRCVVFDKDNTLTAPYVDTIHPSVAASLEACVACFGKSNVAIVSNSAGALEDDPNLSQADAVRTATGLDVVAHREKKPLGFDAVLEHFAKSGTERPVRPSDILVVGDRVLTDTVYANLHGATSLHCMQTLDTRGDNPFALLIRTVENGVLKFFGRRPPKAHC